MEIINGSCRQILSGGKTYVWFGTPAKGTGFPGGPLCVATALEVILTEVIIVEPSVGTLRLLIPRSCTTGKLNWRINFLVIHKDRLRLV